MQRTSRPLSLALVLALGAPLLVACGEDHTEGVATATVTDPATPPPTTSPTGTESAPATGTPAAAPGLTIARDRSSVGFTAAKVTASHDGSFTDFTGTIQLAANDDITASSVEVIIQMDSLVIEPARLAGHLRTPDLLDTTAFPTATFTSTQIAAGSTEAVNGAPATHTVTGNLTLHGQTHAITFPAIIAVSATEVSARAEFSITRQDFGITYTGVADDLIRDAVVIRFDVHAPRS